MTGRGSWFQRFLLPGFVFKAVVIGGGYSTGRELAEFFMPSGPEGGVWGMLLAMAIWSAVCVVAFALARALSVYDYRNLLRAVLGPIWPVFEIAYLLFLVLVLAVMSAAAGEIGAAVLGWPVIAGSLLLMVAIAAVTSFGNDAVEGMFRYTSVFLYLVYALFLVLSLVSFGERIPPHLALDVPTSGWALNGVKYASYNVVAAIAVLPFIRHLTSRRDAVVAGVLAGPLAMLPALIFFLSMVAFYPEAGREALPSDFLLRQIGAPWFHVLFQAMIFCALLETGVGIVNALNERIEAALVARGRAEFSHRGRFLVGSALLLGSGFVAARFGLIALIAEGYGAFGYIMLVVLVAPLMTVGIWRLLSAQRAVAAEA